MSCVGHLLLCLILTTAYVGCASGTTYVFPGYALMSGPNAYSHVQAVSVVSYAFAQVSNAWASTSGDSLELQVIDYAGNPLIAAWAAFDNASQSSALGAFANGPVVDSVYPILSRVGIPLITPNLNKSQYNTTNEHLFSVHSNYQFTVSALVELLNYYAWDSIALLYTQSSDNDLLRNALQDQAQSVAVTQILVDYAVANYSNVVAQLLRESHNVIVMLVPDTTVASGLFAAASNTPLLKGGRAWIYMNQEDAPPLPSTFPQGLMVINYADASPENKNAFLKDVLYNITDQITYPNTGVGATFFSESIFAWDTANLVAAAVDSARQTYGVVNRTTLTSALQMTSYMGYSGLISFNEQGFRAQDGRLISVVNATGGLETIFYFNGTLVSYAQAVFPGNTTTVPDAHTQRYAVASMETFIAVVGNFFGPKLYNLVQYAIWRVNNVPGYLPSHVKLDFIQYDSLGSAGNEVKNAYAISNYGCIMAFGDLTSDLSVVLQDVLQAYNIPQMSPTASASTLSDKSIAPTFFRGIPSGHGEALSFLTVAQYYGWNEVNIISTTDDYSTPIYQVITSQAAAYGISVKTQIVLSAGKSNYTDDLAPFEDTKPRILFLILDQPSMPAILSAMAQWTWKPAATVCTRTLIILDMTLFSAAYGLPLSLTAGWLVVQLPSGTGPVWDKFVATEMPLLTSDPTYAGVDLVLNIMPPALPIFDSVFILADAVTRCVNTPSCDPRNSAQFMQFLHNTSYLGLTGNFSFDANNDRTALLNLFNIQDGYQVKVGTFDPVLPFATNGTVVWPDGSTTVPLAVLPPTLRWLSYSSGAGIALATVAALGLLFAVFTVVVFIWYRESPVILSATWQFLLLMLFGAMLGFGTVYVWIGKPLPYLCGLRMWLPPLAFIAIVAPLLAKTWRLHRIFSMRSLEIVPISLAKLIGIVSVLTLIQVIICIVWIVVGTTDVAIVADTSDSSIAYVTCVQSRANQICAYVTYCYLGILVLITCYLAFRVRKLPKDFNESVWIARTIYNTLLFAGLILILGYSLSKYPVTVLILICVCTIAICFGAICLMMAPKVWELWRHPERRSSSSSNRSTSKNNGGSSHTELQSIGPNTSPAPKRRTDFSLQPSKGSSTHTQRRNPSAGTDADAS